MLHHGPFVQYRTVSLLIFYHSIVLGCGNATLVGDGFCNDETNTPVCNYDGGDCCLNVINNDHCSECTCYIEETCASGFHPSPGAGFCNDETNIAECNYDHGDCCLSNVNTDHCSECTCHHQETCTAGFHPSVGDGFCNDETNNVDCNYDGWDCCGTCVVTDF